MQPFRKALLLTLGLMTAPAFAASPPEHSQGLERIGHIIVLFLENRSFDHLYGLFPGADGIENSGFAAIQVTAEGRQFTALPAVINNLAIWPGNRAMSPGVDTRFAAGLPNGPFRADRYVSLEERTGDLVHRFYQEQEQIDGGKMDKFVAVSGAGALPMGYFDGGSLLLYALPVNTRSLIGSFMRRSVADSSTIFGSSAPVRHAMTMRQRAWSPKSMRMGG